MNLNKNILLILSIFLVLTGCSTDMVSTAGQGFFVHHGLLALIGWAFFPRIMFIFFSAMTGGLLFWVGVIFVPRVMVAYWATTYYWDTNPLLCIIAWVCALSGECLEKKKTISR